MARLISVTHFPETGEIEYVTDDFARIIRNTRTGELTLFRIPTPNDILEHATNVRNPRIADVAEFMQPVRFTPAVVADAVARND